MHQTSKRYDRAVIIGRFQILHLGHLELFKAAFKHANRVVVVLGNSYSPITPKNPFTAAEREDFIRLAVQQAGIMVTGQMLDFVYARNYPYNDTRWASTVANLVSGDTKKTVLIGSFKDESSFYLNFFPQWSFEEVKLLEHIDAKILRELWFNSGNWHYVSGAVPETMVRWLQDWRQKNMDKYYKLVKEKQHLEQYRKQFAALTYEPTFVTADAVVVQNAHVLLVRRRAMPGEGLLALPGGFLNASSDRSVLDAALRELKEETNIDAPEKVLRGSIVQSRVFDAIDRSARGRTITHAFHIQLVGKQLPRVKGGDDAVNASWYPLASLNIQDLFEDHADIIEWATGVELQSR